MVRCHRMCDYHYYHLEEEERPTTMITTIGEYGTRRRVPLRHNDRIDRYGYYHAGSTTGEVREENQRHRLDYVIRLTDRLLRCGTKIITCFHTNSTILATFRLKMANIFLKMAEKG